MNKDNGLSLDDLNLISQNEREMKMIVSQLEKVRQFKLNDYLVCSRIYHDTNQKVPITNSYGTRIKYKVVHVDSNGIPYVKEVSTKGNVRGQIKPLMGASEHDAWGGGPMNPDDFEFEHDPHFVESIILSAEESYDPTEIQRKKKNLRDEITQHNLEAKIKSNVDDLVAAFTTMAPGQTWWFSIKNGMTINKVTLVKPNNVYNQYKKHKLVNEIEVTLSNGKIAVYQPHDFLHKNLYSKQPRTYRELSDSI